MNKFKPQLIALSWILLFVFGIILYFYGITHEAIWYDESFSAAITNHSFTDILRILLTDNNPPLYYFMLKIYKTVLGNSAFALRSLSVLGALALASLGFGPVRKIFGNKTGVIYSFLIFMIPIFSAMAEEARMYTWACFFVTGTALYGYLAATGGRRMHWALFCLMGLACCYIHNYALIAAAIIYFMIMLWIILKDRKKLAAFFVCSGIIIIAYLPWLFVLSRQISGIHDTGFIDPVNLVVILKVLFYPFDNRFMVTPAGRMMIIYILIVFAISIFGILIGLIKKRDEIKMILLAFGTYILVILSVMILSFTTMPLLYPRYTFVILGLLFLTVAFGISQLKNRIMTIVVCILILSISLPQIIQNKSKRINGPMKEAKEFIDKNINKNDVFLHTSPFTFGPFVYYYPNHKHLLYRDADYFMGGKDAFLPAYPILKNKRFHLMISSRIMMLK